MPTSGEPLQALQLRSGAVIADPLAEAYRFIEVDGTYQRYDQAMGGGDGDLTEADVHLANQSSPGWAPERQPPF